MSHFWAGSGRARGLIAVALAVGLGYSVPGCTFAHSCSDIGCQSGLAITVTVLANAVPSGTHTLDLVIDGDAASCTFTFPPPVRTTDGGAIQNYEEASCPAGVLLSLSPAMNCTTVTTATGSENHCEVLTGRIAESIVLREPSSVHIRQSVDGMVLLDQTVTPTYKESVPFSSDCPLDCREASASFTIPQLVDM